MRSSYKKKRKGKPFSGMQRYAAKEKKAVPADDSKLTKHNQAHLVLQINRTHSEKPIGSSRKKMENTSKNLSIESSDNDMSFQPEESKRYRIIYLENLSMVVSSAPVCNEGEKFL